MIYKLEDTTKAEHLFANWEETIIWSCLQKVMGEIYTDALEKPESAMAVCGVFCFLAGRPDKELVMFKPRDYRKSFIIMVPQSDEWAKLIAEEYKEKAKKVTRYAIKKEYNIFDKDRLQKAVLALPEGFSVEMIDEKYYNLCKQHEWSRDLVAQYKDYEAYRRLGLGVVAVKDEIPVSGASSYSSYSEGIEIEIDTKEEYRRRGLAYACGARLILECLKRGLYPSWDAQNKGSVALAEKLGYHYERDYTAFEIEGY